MKNNLCTVIFLFAVSFAGAQINYANIYDTHVNTSAARYFPSMLGTSFGTVEVNIFNVYGWASNTGVTYNQVNNLLTSSQLSVGQLNDILSHRGNTYDFFTGADIQLLDVAFKVKKKKWGELFSMELGERERAMADIQLSKNLLSTLLLGNAQFAGQTVSFTPTAANALYMHDFYCGVSVPIYLVAGDHGIELRPGIRGSFLAGVANVYTQTGDASMYTEPDGQYITMNYNYQFNTSIPSSLSNLISSFPGKGWGLEGGIGMTLDNSFSLDLDAINGGRITFSQNTNNYQRQGSYTFTGLSADLFSTPFSVGSFNLNQNLLNPVQTENKYTTPLAPIFTLRAEYRLGEGTISKKDSAGKYFQHHIFITYVQGTQTLYDATTRPAFSAGYMYSFKNILNVGLSLGAWGYNNFSAGPFISVKGGPFVFSLGSNNLMAFIAPKIGTGVDGYLNLSLNFGKLPYHQRPRKKLPEQETGEKIDLPADTSTEANKVIQDSVSISGVPQDSGLLASINTDSIPQIVVNLDENNNIKHDSTPVTASVPKDSSRKTAGIAPSAINAPQTSNIDAPVEVQNDAPSQVNTNINQPVNETAPASNPPAENKINTEPSKRNADMKPPANETETASITEPSDLPVINTVPTATTLRVKTKPVTIRPVNETPVVAPIELLEPATYRVQLIASRGSLKDKQKMKDVFGKISSQRLSNGIVRYFAGDAPTKKAARELLETAKQNGHPDAFIVRIKDGKRIE